MRKTIHDITAGDWWAPCCLHDLQRASTAEDISEALEFAEDMGIAGVWETCAEAVDDLIQECDAEERTFLLSWYLGKGDNAEIAENIARHASPRTTTG